MVVWGPRAERTAQLREGTPVYVEGRLRTRAFTNADNIEQMRTEIHSLRLMPLRSQKQGRPRPPATDSGTATRFRSKGRKEGPGCRHVPRSSPHDFDVARDLLRHDQVIIGNGSGVISVRRGPRGAPCCAPRGLPLVRHYRPQRRPGVSNLAGYHAT